MPSWEERVAAVWADAEASDQERIERIDELAGERPPDDAIALYERADRAPLHDAVAAFYALALTSKGDAVTAASVALKALAPHLTRYTRSVTAYANDLVGRP